MLLHFFRALFVVIIIAVLVIHLGAEEIAGEQGRYNFYGILMGGVGLFAITFLVDLFTPKKSLGALAGVFFGLMVGIIISWALSWVVDLANDIYRIGLSDMAIQAIKWIMGVCVCYLAISIVVRTKDDVRFVIPYVEFAKQTKGVRPLVVDTSAIIDGRIADLYQSKFFDAPLIVPRFVLNELHLISDSADKLKRNRGRRGLDILKAMQGNTAIEVEIDESTTAEIEEARGVDQKLVVFSKQCNGKIITTDYNLTKVAQVRDVDVLNVNDLANVLKTVALPGELMKIKIIKPGEESDQGVGYLEDGTMVVVEGARNKIGRDILIAVTSSLQTSAGKMIFGKFDSFPQRTNGRNRNNSNHHHNGKNANTAT